MKPLRRCTLLVALLLAPACGAPSGAGGERRVPVEVAPVERGDIALRRDLHASLEASSRIVVATVAGGRVASLPVDMGDPVRRGQVVATLDRGEYAQAVLQAEASRAMAEASLAEAEAQLQLAERELARVRDLQGRGAVSEAELEAAVGEAGRRRAAVEVARAEVARSRAAEGSARVGLDEARIVAAWSGDDLERIVAERLVDEGTFVAPHTPLLAIVDRDPLVGVAWVTEGDHALLQPGQPVTVRTDARPGVVFPGEVARVAPVFDPASRQARVELRIPNPDGRLAPGQFVRAEVILDRDTDVAIVPAEAVVRREGQDAVFVVDGEQVALRPVTVGIEDGDRVEVAGELGDRVVVLGQHLLHDGAAVRVVEERAPLGPDEAADAAEVGVR